MKRSSIVIAVLAALSLALAAGADEFQEYFEFRYTSGLPGGGFAVDPAGHAGFDGAMQINIPIGYTPGAGNYVVALSTAAIDGGFPDRIRGAGVNGTGAWGVGFFGPEHALWAMDMRTGGSGEPAFNLQWQVAPEKQGRPGISIGVIDLFNDRASSRLDPFAADARSFFAAATWEGGTPEKPMYFTLGTGNGRFSPIFGGVSYQPMERLKLMAEYDSFNANIGAAYDVFRSSDNWHGILGLSLVDLDRVNLSFSVTRSSHK